MARYFACLAVSLLSILSSTALSGELSENVRVSVDRITGGQGTYIADEETYKVILPRYEATIVYDWQTLSPNLGVNSWVAFKPGIHGQAILTGQVLLLGDEVDSVISTALGNGLNVTGLAESSVFDGPHSYTLDVTASGTFEELAMAFRKCLDETLQVRRANGHPKVTAPNAPLESSIDSSPLDSALSIKGDLTSGVYRAAIGVNALLGGTQVGREMGMSTWVSVAGTNGSAVAHGEFIATSDDLQKVLKALRGKGMSITSIRNHTIGEHPQLVFVHFWGEGPALELAKAVRYALDAQGHGD